MATDAADMDAVDGGSLMGARPGLWQCTGSAAHRTAGMWQDNILQAGAPRRVA